MLPWILSLKHRKRWDPTDRNCSGLRLHFVSDPHCKMWSDVCCFFWIIVRWFFHYSASMIWGSLCLCFFQESQWAQNDHCIQPFLIVKSPPFIAGFYYNWYAFLPVYFGRILTRTIFSTWMDQPQKMICPGISSLQLARRTQERASPISTGTVHFAHGDCFDDRFCFRPMWEVRISSKHWRQWWNVINDDQQRIMLRMLCMLFHSISSSLVSGSTGESTPKSGWEKGLGTQVLTNGALHHSTFQFVFCDQARREKERHDLSMSEFIQRRQTQNPKK